MIVRAFYSSPLKSAVGSDGDARIGIRQAIDRLVTMPRKLEWLMSVGDVAMWPRHCIWSPLIEGDVIRGNLGVWSEHDALSWCLDCLRYDGFNMLVLSSVPRQDGYGRNGMDAEIDTAKVAGIEIVTEQEFRERF